MRFGIAEPSLQRCGVFALCSRVSDLSGQRLDSKTGMTVLCEYDHVLSAAILDELEAMA